MPPGQGKGSCRSSVRSLRAFLRQGPPRGEPGGRDDRGWAVRAGQPLNGEVNVIFASAPRRTSLKMPAVKQEQWGRDAVALVLIPCGANGLSSEGQTAGAHNPLPLGCQTPLGL